VLVVLTILSTASPCAACSCASRSPEQLFRHADAAFVGSVVGQQAIDQTTTVQTFAVRSVFKGPLGATVDVVQPIGAGGGDTCGLLYGPGETAVILYRQGDGWTTNVCSRLTLAELAAVGPSPVHPVPTPGGTPPPTVAPPPAGGPGAVGWQTGVLGLLAGIAVIAISLSVASRRERTAVPADTPSSEDAAPPRGPPEGSSG
jgi:hypothetical protein